MDEDEKSMTSKRHSKARGQQSLNSNDHPVSVVLMVRANLARSIEKQKGREAKRLLPRTGCHDRLWIPRISAFKVEELMGLQTLRVYNLANAARC